MKQDLEIITEEMNEQQKYASQYDKGALIVLAGPGSGKTKTLVARIALLLEKYKEDSFKILSLTFSRKAAEEMKDRINNLVNIELSKRLYIGTFHSFCLEVLKSYGHYIGIDKNFTIYENDEELINLLKNAVIQRINNELSNPEKNEKILSLKFFNYNIIETTVKDYYYYYIKLKKNLIFPNDINQNSGRFSKEFIFIYQLYIETLKKNSVIDFTDLIYYTWKLFKEKTFLLDRYQRIYKYIMVDEGQDTTKNQFELLKLFTSNNYNNIFIVADEDQLIYEWNDAKFEYLIEMQKILKSEIIQLYINYRCPSKVIELSNKLIKHNKNRLEDKIKIQPFKKNIENCIFINKFLDNKKEMEWIYDRLCNNNSSNNCIIARNKFILEEIATYFDSKNIEYYKTYNTTKYSTIEIQMLIYLLYLLVNENDFVHYNYLCEFFKINPDDIDKEEINITLFDKFLLYFKNDNNLYNQLLKLKENTTLFFDLDLNSFIILFIKDIKLSDDNIKNDLSYIQDEIIRFKNENFEFLSLNNLLSSLAISSKPLLEKGVALLTGHGAKGLEFDNVIIVSLNQDIWPDYRALNDEKKLEEERRNLFVSLTRAKSKLFISYISQKENYNGNMRNYKPSQFLYEMGLI